MHHRSTIMVNKAPNLEYLELKLTSLD